MDVLPSLLHRKMFINILGQKRHLYKRGDRLTLNNWNRKCNFLHNFLGKDEDEEVIELKTMKAEV